MKNLNVICGFCTNNLYKSGVVITTEIGPLLMCDICRGLYYIDIGIDPLTNKFMLAIKIANLPKEEEFQLIRTSTGHTPLAQHVEESSQTKINEEVISGNDIKELINSSVTPSDFLRKLHDSE